MQKLFGIISICQLFVCSAGMLNLKSLSGNSNFTLFPSRAKNYEKNSFDCLSAEKNPRQISLDRKALIRECGKNNSATGQHSSSSSKRIITSKFTNSKNNLPKRINFNHQRQLKLMLQHQLDIEGMQHKLGTHSNRSYNKMNNTMSYNVFALKDALDNEIRNKDVKLSEHQHVLRIVNSLREAIKYLEKITRGDEYVNGHFLQLLAEQMRFIGIILWHFVFRDNPILNAHNDDGDTLMFFTKLSPNIDPSDVVTKGDMLNEIAQQLDARLNDVLEGQHYAKPLKEQQFFEDYNKDVQLYAQLGKEAIARKDAAATAKEGEPRGADMEKRFELARKLQLLRAQYICLRPTHDGGRQCEATIGTPIPLYNIIDRAFIVFGKHAPALILLVKALLEGTMDGKQLEHYLKTDQNVFDYISPDDNDSYIIMASKLGKISKEY